MAVLTAETLNLERLIKACGETIYKEGEECFRKGRVSIDEVTEQSATCEVRGKHSYRVDMQIAGNYLQFRCTCSTASRGMFCEHDVAAAIALQEHLRSYPPSGWKSQLNQVLQVPQTTTRRGVPHPYLLFFSLQGSAMMGYPAFKIIPYQIPLNLVTKAARQVLEAPESGWRGSEGLDGETFRKLIESAPELSMDARSPYNPLNPLNCVNCPPEIVSYANLLIERSRTAYYYTSFPLSDTLAFLASMQNPIYWGSPSNPLEKELEFAHQPGQIQLEVSRDPGGLRLSACLAIADLSISLKDNPATIINNEPLWVMSSRYIFRLDPQSQAEVLPYWLQNSEMIVPPWEETEFLEKYYLPLARRIALSGDAIDWEVVRSEPVKRLYLSDASDGLQAQLRFGYGDHEVIQEANLPEESLIRKVDSWTLVRVIRDSQFEEAAAKSLSASVYGLKRAPYAAQSGVYKLRARINPVDFLLHHIPHLVKDGFEIYGEEQLKTARVNRNKPTLSFNVSSGIDWFDVQTVVNFGELEVSLKEIRRVIRKKERYVKLADGTIGEIPDDWIDKYRYMFGLGQENGENLRLSHHHLTLLDQLMAEADRAQTDPEFERRRQRLRDFTGINPRQIPAGFTGDLRPYQKAGFEWLHFLNEFGFGGCLADDMGLGKTIQVLAFFQSLYRENGRPAKASLVVVPRSLLINWQREASRFTPDLKILEYFDQNRPKDQETFNNYDLIVTTYGVMLRDVEALREYPFEFILLDESQAIKNPLSLTAKAARSLQARRRLALTGTPVENSTMELWSQFAFLNPGLLGNMEYFKETFASPIEKKADENSAQFLRKMVYPFILRRTKAQVAPELPPRSERILYCDMEPAQRKLYLRLRDYYRGMLLGMIETEGINNSRMKILEGLLRLRQVCNHPRLVDEKYRGESGKFELLVDTLETLQSEGHKALIFSQFVQMLRIIRSALDERHIPYLYLDGHTQNRQERVDTFQNDPQYPFFLISLKAGGLGLNLTAADYVIHVDPWWNPAVEMQATDRTHRIGQEKPVFVYKLITRDSVEEKILKLQDRKKELVEQLITTEGSFFKSLTEDDVKVLFGE